MRILGISIAVVLVGLAAFQSILSGTPASVATPEPLIIAAADICPAEAMTVPVIRRETRAFTVMPAHKTLAVTPARFGTRIENLIVVPEHREGATFFTEQERVIVTEPTRRLRVVEPEFETVENIAGTVKRARVAGGILIVEDVPLEAGPLTKILVGDARIQAVRINAGLKMHEIKVIDADGNGALVPASTVPVEVRTVEAHPIVSTTEVEAIVEEHGVDVVDTPAATVEIDALCTMAGWPSLLAAIQTVLDGKGVPSGERGIWSTATIDAVAAAQATDTGLISPHLLLQTLRKWLPDVRIPVS